MTLHYEIDNGTAVLTMDRPPLNALNVALRQALIDALGKAMDDPGVKAIVITGSQKAFSAGADIDEFSEGGLLDPILPRVINLFEQANKPVIASVSGICMGGGLELALGCHYRVIAPNATLALPEVKLGLLPGAGGTQRLPRLIGILPALKLIVTGDTIDGRRAVELGIGMAPDTTDVLNSAKLLAQRVADNKSWPRTRDLEVVPTLERSEIEASTEKQSQDSGNSAALRCAQLVRASAQLEFDAGVKLELDTFIELMNSPSSRALRYVFFSERIAPRIPDIGPEIKPRAIQRCAVVGSGTMGSGIAMCLANAGLPVQLLDSQADALDRAMQRIKQQYEISVHKGKLDQGTMAKRMGLITPALSMTELRDADLVIEATFESIDVKESVFKELDSTVKPGAILATNTSTLDVDRIASFTTRPHDVLGMHFFSPANVMRLLEVVRGARTATDVLATVMTVARQIGKVAVLSGVCYGFIGNRLLQEYLRQAFFLLDEGALPEQVDAALQRFGMAMGPFAMLDMAGGDIAYAVRHRQVIDQPDRPFSTFPDALYHLGRYGQKTGAGFYRYERGQRTPILDPFVKEHLEEHRRTIGIEARSISDQEIVDRCVLALFNEGARVLAEGIAIRASDIDVVYTAGYGFPRHRGGPIFYANELGLPEVISRMQDFEAGYQGWSWQPASLLLDLASNKSQISDLL